MWKDLMNVGAHVGYRLSRRVHTPLHYAYFGLVFVESHGLYGYVALGLLLSTIADLLVGEA